MSETPLPKILIVDDQMANIIATRQVLLSLNVELLTAQSGIEAIGQLLRHNDVALILLDVQMPEMDGFETASLIRGDPDTANIPIIFVTAISKEDQYVFKGYQAGAVDYLFKPVDADILLGKVRIFAELHVEKQKTLLALKEIEKLKRDHEQLLNHAAEGILGLDSLAVIQFANFAACQILETEQSNLIGKNVKDFIAPLTNDDLWQKSPFLSLLHTGGSRGEDDAHFYTLAQRMIPVSYTQAAFTDGKNMQGMVVLFQDITERKEAHKQLETMARYDQLTGLANRSLFWSFLNKTFANASRHGERFALLFIDLDRFKQVNDTLGHDAGDELLRKTSQRLEHCVRESDLIARLGGDEFAIILSHVDSLEIAAHLADRIVHSLSEEFDIMGHQVLIGASVGVANYPDHGEDVETLTKNADTAMYMAKNKGRNNFQFYREEMQQKIERHLMLTNALKIACEQGEFRAVYQPAKNLQTEQICSYQMVLQWNCPGQGWLDVGHRLDGTLAHIIAQRLDDWQIKQGIEFLKKIQANIIEPLSTPTVVIPLYSTATQLEKCELYEVLQLELSASNGLNKNLCIEISESCLSSNSVAVIQEINRFKELGLSLAIRHTGDHQLSLSTLSKVNLNAINIDSDIIQAISNDTESYGLMKAYIHVAKSFGLISTIGGVTCAEQLTQLKSMGCDTVYGPFIGEPVSDETALRQIH